KRTMERVVDVDHSEVQVRVTYVDANRTAASPWALLVAHIEREPTRHTPSIEAPVRPQMMMLEAWCDDVCGLRRHLDGNQQVGLDLVDHPGEVARIDEASEEVDGGESERLHLRDPRGGRRTAASRHYLQ